MAVNRMDWELIHNKLVSTHEGGNCYFAKKIYVSVKPLSCQTTWTCHRSFWSNDVVKVYVKKTDQTTVFSRSVRERNPVFKWAHRKLSGQRGGQIGMHQVKSTFCWVSVHPFFKRCSFLSICLHIQAVIISCLKWGHILFCGFGECDVPNCVYSLWAFLGRSFPSVAAFSMSQSFACYFSSITSVQCYFTSQPFMSCIHPICHLSFTINWPTPACSQLLTPTFSTHFLNFQTSTSLLPMWLVKPGRSPLQTLSKLFHHFCASNLRLWCQHELLQWLDSWCMAIIACLDS